MVACYVESLVSPEEFLDRLPLDDASSISSITSRATLVDRVPTIIAAQATITIITLANPVPRTPGPVGSIARAHAAPIIGSARDSENPATSATRRVLAQTAGAVTTA